MNLVMWIFRIVLFLLILSFAIVNTDPVTIRYYLGFQWEAPLVVALLAAAGLGALLALLAGLFQALRLRRQIAALKRELRAAQSTSPPAGGTLPPPPALL